VIGRHPAARPVRRARSLRRTAVGGMLAGATLFATLVALQFLVRERPAPELAEVPSLPPIPPPPELVARGLVFPVRGVDPGSLVDTFTAPRPGERVHNAVDIMAPRGTPVLAVADGTVQQLGTGGAGGIAVYQVDAEGRFAYYYAHLDRLAAGLEEGEAVRAGQVIGYVGTTGNAPAGAPHLHFAVYELANTARRWGGRPINPVPLWRKEASGG
jgi:murein DD-endopeptidase MepM/ murein hydrolase activator NlpD